MNGKCCICETSLKKVSAYSYRCRRCNLYASDLKPGVGRGIEGIEPLRKDNFKALVGEMLKLEGIENFKILEIGSGAGHFIEECRRNHLDITGSEADEKQYGLLQKKYRAVLKIALPLKTGDKTLAGRFDAVVFNDVFEHLENINLVVEQTKTFLRDEGYVIVNIPSADGLIFRTSEILQAMGIHGLHDRIWQKGLSSPHLLYFGEKNIKKLFLKHGFNCVKSGCLNTVSKNNYERLRSMFSSAAFCTAAAFLLRLFFYCQRFLPKDIIFLFFQREDRGKPPD